MGKGKRRKGLVLLKDNVGCLDKKAKSSVKTHSKDLSWKSIMAGSLIRKVEQVRESGGNAI